MSGNRVQSLRRALYIWKKKEKRNSYESHEGHESRESRESFDLEHLQMNRYQCARQVESFHIRRRRSRCRQIQTQVEILYRHQSRYRL